jgi:hypothetical protein
VRVLTGAQRRAAEPDPGAELLTVAVAVLADQIDTEQCGWSFPGCH